MISESYLATASAAVSLLAHQSVADAWAGPSALTGYAVSGLAGHLAGQVNVVAKALDGPEPDTEPVALVDYFLQARWIDAEQDSEVHRGIRSRGADYAASGPRALASRTAEVLDRLRRDLPRQPPSRVVQFPWGPPSLRLDDLLANRMMELVVHLDDLAVSVGVPTPELPVAATDAVVSLLATLAARRRGSVPVLRALTRAERAPTTITAF
ncbi:maleylpyruvate isomerase family mycothiol-dependent enzyme [Streptacidiphilus melanogenes]|uniref:maleylpyruvate isomerase family mycothiol-dependent enzyme n=1 Tax=Streptacidiphilus melanogenes TaxID=411235 RepID=UPI0005AB5424|nr:maleylpyruvate isomerase family mycothiol-dependent enzyme [Streptacidiphilus melanogenes]